MGNPYDTIPRMSRLKYCIAFAGVPGSSKTPIAHHLGWNLNLPLFNNDILRTEVVEDCGYLDQPIYEQRRDERLRQILSIGRPFIYDASVDRQWGARGHDILEAGFDVFIISMELSKDFLVKLYQDKGYTQVDQLDERIAEHEHFIKEYGHLISLQIIDADFPQRLGTALSAVRDWLA